MNKELVTKLFEDGVISKQEYDTIIARLSTPQGEASGITVKKLLKEFESFMKSEFSSNTASGYITNTRNFIEFIMEVNSINDISENAVLPMVTAQKIQQWFNKLLSTGYSATSIRRYKHSIVKFFEYAKSEHDIAAPEIDKVEVPTSTQEVELDALRHEEIIEIANNANSLRDKALILVMYEAGMRRQEIIDCLVSDVDFNKGTVQIKTSAGTVDRIGYISQSTIEITKKHIEEWKDLIEETNEKRRAKGNNSFVADSGYLFQTLRSPQISYAVVFKAIKDASLEYFLNKAVGEGLAEGEAKVYAEEQANRMNTETFRRSRRAYYFAQGKSVEQVQTLMGDENYYVCKRYLKVAQQIYPELFM